MIGKPMTKTLTQRTILQMLRDIECTRANVDFAVSTYGVGRELGADSRFRLDRVRSALLGVAVGDVEVEGEPGPIAAVIAPIVERCGAGSERTET